MKYLIIFIGFIIFYYFYVYEFKINNENVNNNKNNNKSKIHKFWDEQPVSRGNIENNHNNLGECKINVIDIKEPNFVIQMGEDSLSLSFHYCVNKTMKNRIKYWLFCRFFPFEIVKWERD